MTDLIKKAMEAADAYANAFNANGSSAYNPTTAEARKALEDAISAIRSATKEEDARLCEGQSQEPECPERAQYCADAIRASK